MNVGLMSALTGLSNEKDIIDVVCYASCSDGWSSGEQGDDLAASFGFRAEQTSGPAVAGVFYPKKQACRCAPMDFSPSDQTYS